MNRVSVVEARKKFSDLMARVAYAGQRIVVERRGKPMMAWISVEDLRRLAELEVEASPIRVQRQTALEMAADSRQRIRAERSGVPLPDSANVSARLREESEMDIGASVSPRVLRVLNLIRRLEPRERRQLGLLLPPDVTSPLAVPEEALAEAMAYFQDKARQRPTSPSLDDPFIAGLTYRQYFALPDDQADALWEELAAEAPSLEELPVIEVRPDARLPA